MKFLNKFYVLIFLIGSIISHEAHAADRYWIATTTASWKSPSNWSATSNGSGGASVPTSADVAIFDGGSASSKVGNCTIDTIISVAGFNITAGYTGTISQGANAITIGTSNASYSGGTFTGGSASITLNGTFTLAGTTFTSTSGTMTFNSTVTNTSGSFTHNNGTVSFSSSSSQTIPAWNFYNLTSTSTGARPLASSGIIGIASVFTKGTNSYTPVTGSTVNYNGTSTQTIVALSYYNLTISQFRDIRFITLASSGTIGIAGTFSNTATFSTGGYVITGSTINYNGTGAQTIIAFNYNSLTISGARTTNNVILANSGTIGIASIFTNSATFTTGGYVNTGSTIDYNGSGAQTIKAFNYNNLSSSSTGTRTLVSTGSIGIAGTFSKGTNAYTITGSTINYNGTGSQTVIAFDYNNLIISGSRSTNNVTMAGSGVIKIAKSFYLFATFTSGSIIKSGSTVEYNGSLAQTITSFAYHNLTSSGTGARSFATTGTVKIDSIFTPGSNTYNNYGSEGEGLLPLESGLTTHILGVSVISASTAFVCGNGGIILKTTDGGATWASQSSGTTIDLFSISFFDSNNGIAVGNSGKVTVTNDGGATWTLQTLTTQGLRYVYYVSSSVVFVMGGNGLIYKSINGGSSWTSTSTGTTQTFYGMYFTHADTGYASGWLGTLVKTTNGGSNWSALTSGTTEQLASITFISSSTGFAVGANGKIIKTTNSGSSWSPVTSGTTNGLNVIDFVSSTTGFIFSGNVTDNAGLILKTINGGVSWTPINTGTTRIYCANLYNSSVGYLVGLDGMIMKYTCCSDGGTVEFSGNSSQTIPALNYHHLTSSSSGARVLASSDTIGISGTFTPGSNSYTATGSTIDFNGAAQNVPSFTFNNLTARGTGDKTALGTLTINGTLNINAGRTLNLSTNLLSGILSSISGSGKLSTQNTSSTPIPSGKTWSVDVEYTGNNQTLLNGTYNNLLIYGGIGTTKTASGNLTVNGGLTIALAQTMNMGVNLLDGTLSSLSGLGELKTQNTSSLPIPVNKTWPFQVQYNSSSPQTIVHGNYSNLNSTGGDRTLSSAGIIGISSVFTPGSGTFTTTGSTVDFNGITAQSIPVFGFNNLIISGARTSNSITFNAGTITVAGNVTMNPSFTTGGFITTGNTFLLNGTTNQYLNGTSNAIFGKLQVNKAIGKLICLQPVTINDQLILSEGVIGSTATNYVGLETGATVIGASDSSYVCGLVSKKGNTSFSFPLGDTILTTGAYHPLEISAPGLATDIFLGQYYAVDQTYGDSLQIDSLESINNCEYWLLTRYAGSSVVTPSVGWNSNSCSIESFQRMRVVGWDGAQWKSMGNTGVTVTGNMGLLKGASGINLSAVPITIGLTKPVLNPYATLKKQLDGGFYIPILNKMYFKFEGEYTQETISYTIYDATTGAPISGTPIINTSVKNYGDNRYELNLSGALTPSGKFYTLEAKNEKNVMYYLKFKY